MLMNYHLEHYDLKIFLKEVFGGSKGQNYSLALEMLNGDNMQCNASGVKCKKRVLTVRLS